MRQARIVIVLLMLLLALPACRRGGEPRDQVRPTPIGSPTEETQEGGGAGEEGGGVGQPQGSIDYPSLSQSGAHPRPFPALRSHQQPQSTVV